MTNLTRQLIETVEPERQLKRLLHSLRFWSWGRLLEKAGAKACLVSDADFIDLMKKEVKDLKTPYILKEEAFDEIKRAGYTSIIVLVKNNEAQFVKALRAEFSDADIYSTLYDIIPSKMFHPFELPDLKIQDTPVNLNEAFRNTTLVISSPGSDCEYFLQSLLDNGFGRAPHIFNKPFKNMIEYSDHFDIARFLKSAQAYQNPEGHTFIYLQSDVLNQMLFRSNFSFKQLRKQIIKSGMKVIYFYRRDKLAQTAIQALMEDRYMRSIWHMPPPQKDSFCKNRKVSNEIAWRTMLETMDTEARLENFFKNLPKLKMVTLEEFRDAPENVVKNLAQFLETAPPETIKINAYTEPYEEITNLVERITDFKRTMIDRMGLHVNTKGSLDTENEAFLKRK
jgi:hypothetical protein